MAQPAITVRTIMDMVVADPDSAAGHLSKVYDWRYSERVTTAKALVGAASALVLTPLLPFLQSGSELTWWGAAVQYGSAVVLLAIGAGMYRSARRIHREFLAAQSLLGRLVEIRPFLRRYEESRA